MQVDNEFNEIATQLFGEVSEVCDLQKTTSGSPHYSVWLRVKVSYLRAFIYIGHRIRNDKWFAWTGPLSDADKEFEGFEGEEKSSMQEALVSLQDEMLNPEATEEDGAE